MTLRFRKKPVVVEAVQWAGDNPEEIVMFMHPEKPRYMDQFSNADDLMGIETLEGLMVANKGDWIIKGIQGEFYPCKPDIFEATYEPAGAQTVPVGAMEAAYREGWSDGRSDAGTHYNEDMAWNESNVKAALPQTGDSMDFSSIIKANEGKEEFVQPEGPLEMRSVPEDLREALAELVRLKDIKERLEEDGAALGTGTRQKLSSDYARNKEKAWIAARDALSPSQSEVGEWTDRALPAGWYWTQWPDDSPEPGFEDEPTWSPERWCENDSKQGNAIRWSIPFTPPQVVKDALKGGGE